MRTIRIMTRIGLAAAVSAVILHGLTASASADSRREYRVYISNNFVGNDWRQQMLRSVQIAARKPPLAGRVVLKVDNVETTTQAQINSLNNIIRVHPDAILIDAGSGDALNPTIERACRAGIVVVSFDQVVSAACAFKVQADFDAMASGQGAWMVAALRGHGKILVDRGLAGAPVSRRLQDGFEAVLKKAPGIEIVGYFNGNYALGPEQAGVADLLAANPKVDGILSQAYGTGAMKALQEAGRPMVPITAAAFNGTALACLNIPNAKCILGPNPPYLSAEALRLAVAVLDGDKPPSKDILVRTPLLTNDLADAGPGAVAIAPGKTAFSDQPPGLSLPISPDWVRITPAEATGQ
jgi:ribose transport system substrate-binding protein